jgi:hypothetical protein
MQLGGFSPLGRPSFPIIYLRLVGAVSTIFMKFMGALLLPPGQSGLRSIVASGHVVEA